MLKASNHICHLIKDGIFYRKNLKAVYAFNYAMFSAFNYSGGYFNPVLATALKWGCRGHSNLEHIIVYWCGACMGAILSVPMFRMKAVRKYLVSEEKVKLMKLN